MQGAAQRAQVAERGRLTRQQLLGRHVREGSRSMAVPGDLGMSVRPKATVNPKLKTLTVSSGFNIRLPGFRSRCTSEVRCATGNTAQA